MKEESQAEFIATSSVDEGLDFGCSLLSSAIAKAGDNKPDSANLLLRTLTQYIELRYAGELYLALKYLISLGKECNQEDFRSKQFWAQISWNAEQMNLSSSEFSDLSIPLSDV